MEEKIKDDLKKAMLSKDEVSVATLRLLVSEIRNVSIAKNSPLTDQDIVSVVQKEVKKRKEGAAGFRQAGREELAQKEESEQQILENYLPAQLSNEELTKIIEATINILGASDIKDMGKVIGGVMGKVGQGAEGGRVSAIVKEKLTH